MVTQDHGPKSLVFDVPGKQAGCSKEILGIGLIVSHRLPREFAQQLLSL
jgi:hypothetical protein